MIIGRTSKGPHVGFLIIAFFIAYHNFQVGTVITKNNAAAELKPADTASPNNAAGGKIEEEFTVAR